MRRHAANGRRRDSRSGSHCRSSRNGQVLHGRHVVHHDHHRHGRTKDAGPRDPVGSCRRSSDGTHERCRAAGATRIRSYLNPMHVVRCCTRQYVAPVRQNDRHDAVHGCRRTTRSTGCPEPGVSQSCRNGEGATDESRSLRTAILLRTAGRRDEDGHRRCVLLHDRSGPAVRRSGRRAVNEAPVNETRSCPTLVRHPVGRRDADHGRHAANATHSCLGSADASRRSSHGVGPNADQRRIHPTVVHRQHHVGRDADHDHRRSAQHPDRRGASAPRSRRG
ncbi:hypothetical protein ATL42_1284 [Sanguibacter antarcticus]|uniref:Uncharacterized protein n=1 Tax=Sanguibacter antarcticus TaxID=372484 RepID=A0A2A9E4D3_9MICO|nr:hypothetical protein ATL42_1284 [Sanguibacter antarcticus]